MDVLTGQPTRGRLRVVMSQVTTSTRQPTIVVGVSGSPASAAALRWAATEARRLGGQLRVVLIWHAVARAPYAPAPSPGNREERRQRACRDLATLVQEVLGPVQPENVIVAVAEGTAEHALVDESTCADLLVLGSASAHSADGRPIGPVIRTCLSHARCPVVVVAPEC